MNTQAWRARNRELGRCRECTADTCEQSTIYCTAHLARSRESSRVSRMKKRRAQREKQRIIQPRRFIPSAFNPRRLPVAMDFITKPFAESIPDGSVALFAACPWLAP